eukprot:CAMPEP_0173461412 /NCGR_PEP_ID=MMETSP1357-20121228/64895_1 /TAXON_ID=77926 /ORGANISM="Hemiselmis rufescens, Strain PCC563" /LENGTH=116 /DNA_ID=CAMNT_0014429057 /DNA_START=24 /DNA_END=371 /DNA_ORIENTATION=+
MATDHRMAYQAALGSQPFASEGQAPYLNPRGYQAALSQQLKQLSTPAGYPHQGHQSLVYMAPRPFVPVPSPQQSQRGTPYGTPYGTPSQAQAQQYQPQYQQPQQSPYEQQQQPPPQ